MQTFVQRQRIGDDLVRQLVSEDGRVLDTKVIPMPLEERSAETDRRIFRAAKAQAAEKITAESEPGAHDADGITRHSLPTRSIDVPFGEGHDALHIEFGEKQMVDDGTMKRGTHALLMTNHSRQGTYFEMSADKLRQHADQLHATLHAVADQMEADEKEKGEKDDQAMGDAFARWQKTHPQPEEEK